jgi:predicted kinase
MPRGSQRSAMSDLAPLPRRRATDTTMRNNATLHMLCGKIAAGKSTLARQLACAPQTILLDQDEWLSRLFPGEIVTIHDFTRCSARLRLAIGGLIGDLLRAGISVVLDFPANTPTQRTWMRGLAEAGGAEHVLHVIELPDEVCRARMHQRNAAGSHPYQVTDAEYDTFMRFFMPPAPEEGLNLSPHPPSPPLRGRKGGEIESSPPL